jgi:site-specific DNA-methyltransferase (adenine-specific)
MNRLPRNQILIGDAREVLATLPADSVDCVITSPPYFRLRNYQNERQIGLEAHVDDWVHELLLVGRKLAVVLKGSGSLWLNLGDTYSRHAAQGALEKSLLLAPERLALALTKDGWILRNKVIWAKTNPVPSSVHDRLSCTYDLVYFFVRERRYFFDLDAVRVPHTSKRSPSRAQGWSLPFGWRGPSSLGENEGLNRLKAQGQVGHPLGKNPGDVWSLSTGGYRSAHHSVFPETLAERPLLATCPEKVCSRCGKPWIREPLRRLGHLAVAGELHASCDCKATSRPGLVLDPFMGSGTVASAATRFSRDWLGIELNPAFAELAADRLRKLEQRAPPQVAA